MLAVMNVEEINNKPVEPAGDWHIELALVSKRNIRSLQPR